MIGELEQSPQASLQQPRLRVDVVCDVQVGPADVADQKRVAAEHKPRLVGSAAATSQETVALAATLRSPRRKARAAMS